jgi:citrate synthase
MLESIRHGGHKVKDVVESAKRKESKVRLMGFGHRVYKTYDPRAKIAKKSCMALLDHLGMKHDPLLDIALELEDAALSDPYFKEKNLYPNVDYYTGIAYRAMGIPTNMFTVMFAIGRLPGWIAHWLENSRDPEQRIMRPRQMYTGEDEKKFVPIKER